VSLPKDVGTASVSILNGCSCVLFADWDRRYLLAATNYYDSSSYLKLENLPSNDTIAGLAHGLAEAHKAYDVEGYAPSLLKLPSI